MLLIISSFFPNANVGLGPWSARFNGLYCKLIKKPIAVDIIYWYSVSERMLYTKKADNYKQQKMSFFNFLFQILIAVFKHKNKIIFLIAYPCFRMQEVLVSEIFVKVIAILRKLSYAKIITDFVDPPIFMTQVGTRHKLIEKIILYYKKREEKKCLLCSDVIITNADSMADFLREKYNLESKRFISIPMGINVSDFSPAPERFHRKQFTIFYGGTIDEDRGILSLIECIERINKKVRVNLILCGRISKSTKVPQFSWLKVFSHLTYKQYCNIIIKYADIGIIPYPVNDWWGLVSISKLATYLAAGISVLTTNLFETASYLKKYDCGFVASSWQDMDKLVIRLYENRQLCLGLGNNARRAAEKTLDWGILANNLYSKLERHLGLR